MKFLVKILSTGFFTGYIPFASGTFGSLIGVILYFFVLSKVNHSFFLIFILFAFIGGIFICDFAEKKIFKVKDSSHIVLDEIIGSLITLFPLRNADIFNVFIGLFLFRIFDIIKPFPIKKLQALSGGVGIVIDDVVA